MCLGQAIIYIDPKLKDFVIICEENTILGAKKGNFVVCKRYDDRLQGGDILNIPILNFSVINDKIAIII